MRTRRKLLLGLGLSLGLVLVTDQVIQHVALADDVFLGRPVAPFDPPLFSTSQIERLERIERSLALGDPPPESLRFDADLGWCNPPEGGRGAFRYDWAGARIGVAPLARTKPDGVQRLAIYGCSMTHGDEVGAEEAWVAQLDARLDAWEVANMGVSAFGLDQALLRLRRDGPALDADEVWLVWMPEASLRITTLYRPFLRHWSIDVAFKPRLRRGATGVLEPLPNPARELADIPRLLRDQAFLLERIGDGDPWVERARRAYEPRGSSLLHASGIWRVLATVHEASGRELPGHFVEGHPTRALLQAIVEHAAAEAATQGASFRLVVIPGPTDRVDAAQGGAWWEAVCEELVQGGVDVHDLTEALTGGANLYAEHGHLNASGSALAAEALSSILAP